MRKLIFNLKLSIIKHTINLFWRMNNLLKPFSIFECKGQSRAQRVDAYLDTYRKEIAHTYHKEVVEPLKEW